MTLIDWKEVLPQIPADTQEAITTTTTTTTDTNHP
jgi:hypothetical protein